MGGMHLNRIPGRRRICTRWIAQLGLIDNAQIRVFTGYWTNSSRLRQIGLRAKPSFSKKCLFWVAFPFGRFKHLAFGIWHLWNVIRFEVTSKKANLTCFLFLILPLSSEPPGNQSGEPRLDRSPRGWRTRLWSLPSHWLWLSGFNDFDFIKHFE